MPHPDRETLVQYLNGTLPDGAGRALQRHLSLCSTCEERLIALAPGAPPDEDYQGLVRRLLDSRREEGAAIRHSLTAERAAAPGLWREIASAPQERRLQRVLDEPRFQTWGFFELLIDRAYTAIQEDARAAEDLLGWQSAWPGGSAPPGTVPARGRRPRPGRG